MNTIDLIGIPPTCASALIWFAIVGNSTMRVGSFVRWCRCGCFRGCVFLLSMGCQGALSLACWCKPRDATNGKRSKENVCTFHVCSFSRECSRIFCWFSSKRAQTSNAPAMVVLEWGKLDKNSNLVDSASSIRLSQRLSHACLSINNFIRETANGSLYQL